MEWEHPTVLFKKKFKTQLQAGKVMLKHFFWDYHLLGPLKDALRGQHFASDPKSERSGALVVACHFPPKILRAQRSL
jgi:hypothetical protein